MELAKSREEASQPFVLRRRSPACDRCVVQDVALLGMSSLVDVFVASGVDPEPVLQDLKYLVASFPPGGVGGLSFLRSPHARPRTSLIHLHTYGCACTLP